MPALIAPLRRLRHFDVKLGANRFERGSRSINDEPQPPARRCLNPAARNRAALASSNGSAGAISSSPRRRSASGCRSAANTARCSSARRVLQEQRAAIDARHDRQAQHAL